MEKSRHHPPIEFPQQTCETVVDSECPCKLILRIEACLEFRQRSEDFTYCVLHRYVHQCARVAFRPLGPFASSQLSRTFNDKLWAMELQLGEALRREALHMNYFKVAQTMV